MGKTLKTYFSELEDCSVHQFYIHSEVPTDGTVCTDYYRFTDSDALKALIPFSMKGTIFNQEDIQEDRAFSRTDSGSIGKIYQYGRKRTGGIYLARNTVWKRKGWKNRQFREWLDEVSPDLVFLAAGDYAFIYDIALYIADYCHCALVVLCTDDYFLVNDDLKERGKGRDQKEKGILDRAARKQLLKAARRTMKRAECILCMCDDMRDQYRRLFNRKAVTVYTGAAKRERQGGENPARLISYVGYLGGNRHRSLIELGNAIADLGLKEGPYAIEVYSNEKRSQIVSQLQEARGIRFHGEADRMTAEKVTAESEYVVHVEGFDPDSRRAVRYSISTKIADYLMNGPCIIAYGPEEAASMKYLSDHGAGFVITDKNRLADQLKMIFSDREKCREVILAARELANKNHDPAKVNERIASVLKESIKNYSDRKGEGHERFGV